MPKDMTADEIRDALSMLAIAIDRIQSMLNDILMHEQKVMHIQDTAPVITRLQAQVDYYVVLVAERETKIMETRGKLTQLLENYDTQITMAEEDDLLASRKRVQADRVQRINKATMKHAQNLIDSLDNTKKHK